MSQKQLDCSILADELRSIRSILESQKSPALRWILLLINYSFVLIDPLENMIRSRFQCKNEAGFMRLGDAYLLSYLFLSALLYWASIYYWREKSFLCLMYFVWRVLAISLSHAKTITDAGLRSQGVYTLPPQSVTRTLIFTFKSVLELSLCYGFFYFYADVVSSNYLLNALSVFTTQGIDMQTYHLACLGQQFILFTQMLVLINTFGYFLGNIFSYTRK